MLIKYIFEFSQLVNDKDGGYWPIYRSEALFKANKIYYGSMYGLFSIEKKTNKNVFPPKWLLGVREWEG